MASPSEDDVFERLKNKIDPQIQAQREAEVNKRVHAHYESAQSRLTELIDSNTTLPVTISSISVLNATNTRRGFLHRIFNPLLSANNDLPFTLVEALTKVQQNVDKLNRFDIYHSPISLYFDKPDPSDPSTAPTDISVFLSVREKSRVVFSSGTWAGSNDGSVYFNLLLRNILGGAESLNANAAFGTRTRSSYSASFDTPVLSNPDLKWEIAGLASATNKSWASHEEVLKGGLTKLKYITPGGHRHEFGYSGMWRQVTGLAEKASQTVRADAGDSFKSSLTHTWIHDRRDYPLLPSSGYFMKTVSELAGWGPLAGDVAFAKVEAETQAAVPLPIPGVSAASDSGVSLTAGLRAGVLYPLALGGSPDVGPRYSRINDRFTLGGPTDVRGFRYAGLGPHDGGDAVGGDVFAAGGANLLFPFPRVGKDKPLRLQAFINGGRLLSLHETDANDASRVGRMEDTVANARESVRQTLAQLTDGLPSSAFGFGVVYALPVARFELNFTLPLVVRGREEARKGLSLGVGLEFL